MTYIPSLSRKVIEEIVNRESEIEDSIEEESTLTINLQEEVNKYFPNEFSKPEKSEIKRKKVLPEGIVPYSFDQFEFLKDKPPIQKMVDREIRKLEEKGVFDEADRIYEKKKEEFFNKFPTKLYNYEIQKDILYGLNNGHALRNKKRNNKFKRDISGIASSMKDIIASDIKENLNFIVNETSRGFLLENLKNIKPVLNGSYNELTELHKKIRRKSKNGNNDEYISLLREANETFGDNLRIYIEKTLRENNLERDIIYRNSNYKFLKELNKKAA